jgi:hypothetical protein
VSFYRRHIAVQEREGGRTEGYVVQKGGRYCAVIYAGIDLITGREMRCWHPAGTDRDAADALAARLAAHASPSALPTGLTLATFMLRRWLPAKRVSLRPSMWDGYRRLVELHVIPRLGHVPSPLQGTTLVRPAQRARGSQREDRPRGARADACRKGLINSNLATRAEAPRRRRSQSPLRSWNAEQLREFLATARAHRLRLRPGE